MRTNKPAVVQGRREVTNKQLQLARSKVALAALFQQVVQLTIKI